MTALILVSESAARTSRKAAVALQLWSFPATMLTFGMLKNLFALVFLALAVSPFTAPFQTCAEATAAVVAPSITRTIRARSSRPSSRKQVA